VLVVEQELRQKAITRNMDMDEIESCVHEAVAEVTEGIRYGTVTGCVG
jgi:hypothetical protein